MAKDKKATAPAPVKSKDARIEANKKRRVMKDADRKIKDATKTLANRKTPRGTARKVRRSKIDFTKKEGE